MHLFWYEHDDGNILPDPSSFVKVSYFIVLQPKITVEASGVKPSPKADPKPDKWIYLPEITDTVSSMECTGLMPSLPQNEEEIASYHQLSTMAIPPAEPEPFHRKHKRDPKH